MGIDGGEKNGSDASFRSTNLLTGEGSQKTILVQILWLLAGQA
jgi:hypothetical protein